MSVGCRIKYTLNRALLSLSGLCPERFPPRFRIQLDMTIAIALLQLLVLVFVTYFGRGLSLRPSPPSKANLQKLVEKHAKNTHNPEQQLPPLRRSVIHTSCSSLARDATYSQKVTGTLIVGSANISEACDSFDSDFQSVSDPKVSCAIGRISTLSRDTVQVQWNVTWVPPTAAWLLAFPGEAVPNTYNHLSGDVSSFSWGSVGRVFKTAILTGKVHVPLACIEGRSVMRFRSSDRIISDGREEGGAARSSDRWDLESINEELSYAEDLRRGVLLNRRCAADLRLFLESGRRPPNISWEEWEDTVARCLPWETVPGSNPLDIEPMSEEEGFVPAFFFIGIVTAALLAFADFLAPVLLGHTLY